MRFIIKIQDYDCGDYEIIYPKERVSRVPNIAYEINTKCRILRRFKVELKHTKKFRDGFVLNQDANPDDIIRNIVNEKTILPFDYNDKEFKAFISNALSYNVYLESEYSSTFWVVEAFFNKKVFVFDTDSLEEFIKIVSDYSNSVDKFDDSDLEFEDGQRPDYCITFN